MTKTKILIIDDEEELLKSLKTPLEKVVDKVYTAREGKEGLSIFQEKGPFDCVVCDIEMPGMIGVEVLKSIRASGSDVPFIFFTAFGSRERMLEVVKYGAHDFIEKPQIQELVSSVKNLVFNMSLSEADIENELTEYKKMLKGRKDED